MIAPIRNPSSKSDERLRAISRARRMIAQSLLESQKSHAHDVERVPVWQAWLVAIWVLAIAAAFGMAMFRWWRGG
jgi:hypothetical protein